MQSSTDTLKSRLVLYIWAPSWFLIVVVKVSQHRNKTSRKILLLVAIKIALFNLIVFVLNLLLCPLSEGYSMGGLGFAGNAAKAVGCGHPCDWSYPSVQSLQT